MNKLLYLSTLSLCLLLSSCGGGESDPYTYQPHVGVWEDRGLGGPRAVLVLRRDGSGSIRFNGEMYEFSYVIDYSRKPVSLDLLYHREGEPFRAKLIVKFLDINRFKWRTFFGETRPHRFPRGDDPYTVTLNRRSPYV